MTGHADGWHVGNLFLAMRKKGLQQGFFSVMIYMAPMVGKVAFWLSSLFAPLYEDFFCFGVFEREREREWQY